MKNYVAVKQSISISLDNTLWEMRLMCCTRGDFISHELHTRYKSPSDGLKKLLQTRIEQKRKEQDDEQ